MRIHELAKKYNVTSEELIELLEKHGHKVAGESSNVSVDMLTVLDKNLKTWSNTPTKKSAKKSTAATKAAKAVATDTAKAKVKLRKAKVAEPEPAPEPVSDKPKVKLAKANKPGAVVEAPRPEPVVEHAPCSSSPASETSSRRVSARPHPST